ncbi:MAG: serine hydrolase [Rhodospirillaceae bacterium]|nr:serine hydrolase [Rhodospirillaceae bacterium]
MTTHSRLLRKSLLIALILIAVAAIIVDQAVPDWMVVKRRLTLPDELPWPIEIFQPQVRVAGNPSKRPSSLLDARTISAVALDQVVDEAKANATDALLVYHRGLPALAWYREGVAPETILHSYHMQYTPLVLLIGIALSEGRIKSVDEPAAAYLTEWRGDARERITIKHLLQMSAGLELRFDASYSDDFFSRDALAYWGTRTKDVILTYPATKAPGVDFDYNYIIPELLGIILERATGRSYQDYLSERLWRPLRNHDAFLWLNRPGGEAHQDAGLFSTAGDWLNLGVMMLDNGSFDGKLIVPPSWIDMMRVPSPANPNFGFIWLGHPYAPERRMASDPRVRYVVRSAEPFAADDVFYIDGYGGQRVYVVPSAELVAVRIGQPDRSFDNSRLVNILLRGQLAVTPDLSGKPE